MKRGTRQPGTRDHSHHIHTVFPCQNHACNTLASNAVPPNPTKSQSKNKTPFSPPPLPPLAPFKFPHPCLSVFIRGSNSPAIRLSKSNTMVNSQQGQGVGAYKKKHSFNRQKFFFLQNLHDSNETLSTDLGWHPRCLNAARTREMRFPVTEPEQPYEENRSDY
jgi:hypothetical protein